MSDDLTLTIAGIGIAIAVPLTFVFANWVRKNVDHGEARFDSESGKRLPDDPAGDVADEPARPARRIGEG